jgi:hypothetical protein
MGRRHLFQQLDAGLRVAVLEQRGGRHDIELAEQQRRRAAAEVGIELAAALGVRFDLRHQLGGA